MNVELPERVQKWVSEQAKMHDHATPEAFVADVLNRLEKRWRQSLEEKLLAGLDSGEPIEITPEYWKERERRVEEAIRNHGKTAGCAMNIELPDSQRSWLQQQAECNGHASPDAFVADLVEREKKRWQLWVDKELRAALDEGDFVEVTPAFWEEVDRKIDECARRGGKAAG